ncbi:MAG: hypothetical protein GY823_05840 [Flavobacteriaceae bacterium]|nr:hypothetical protein [Flavobacteriaceae bacterium]
MTTESNLITESGNGFVEKNDAWCSCNGERIGQGKLCSAEQLIHLLILLFDGLKFA